MRPHRTGEEILNLASRIIPAKARMCLQSSRGSTSTSARSDLHRRGIPPEMSWSAPRAIDTDGRHLTLVPLGLSTPGRSQVFFVGPQ